MEAFTNNYNLLAVITNIMQVSVDEFNFNIIFLYMVTQLTGTIQEKRSAHSGIDMYEI